MRGCHAPPYSVLHRSHCAPSSEPPTSERGAHPGSRVQSVQVVALCSDQPASVGLHVVDHPPCDLPDYSSRALLPEAGTRRGRLARTVSAVSPGNGTGRDAVGSRCSDPEGSSPGTGRCLVPQVGPVRALVATWLAGARRSLTAGRGRARGRGCGETPPHSACRGARRAPWRLGAASARRGPAGLRTGCGAHGARRACARASS